jgi:hypothetical protein
MLRRPPRSSGAVIAPAHAALPDGGPTPAARELARRSALSAAQLQQRRAAALTHGAHSQGRSGQIAQRWRRLRRQLNKKGVGVRDIPTAAWLNLQLLVRYLVLIQRVDAWLEAQEDIAFSDAASGALHPVVERYTSWLSSAAAIVARLPAEVVVAAADDLAALASQPARGWRR